ncbi:OmpA family protein [Pistricoccus aurantiacus]|uniref:OmpA family protein n=1 Tax=Pistricoccus aurantiacus TaxID=1883414 RepID=A0A5B8SS80_9GAMM|nr:OmpA family protein [Pistricoccus aurantiacus]QEA38847.1 OmpA family protein [Pistricoccus aurantiacus]
MANINTLAFEELTALGLSAADARRITRRREASIIMSLGDLEGLELSREGWARLDNLSERGEIVFGAPARTGFAFSFEFNPKLADISLLIGAKYNDTEGTDQIVEREMTASVPERLEQRDVNLDKPVSLWVRTRDGGNLLARSYTPQELLERRDGPIAYAHHEIDLLPLVLPEIRRFQRAGLYMVPAQPAYRFDGYRLSATPVGSATAPLIRELLAIQSLATAAVKIDPQSEQTAQKLAAFPLAPVRLDFDGSFSIDQPVPAIEGPIGWAWFLTGPAFFFGFQADAELEKARRNIVILLPTFALPDVTTDDVPMDADEQAILNRPDIFADDPGVVCKPFDNPGRILGERRFSTVLRVTDPEIGLESLSRREVGRTAAIPWEEDPTRYQAVSLSRGHILDMRVRYRSNGYSLGDVAHSMTLAPRQTRRIVKVDWDRRERASRREAQLSEDEVSQITLRDRSYTDAVESSLNEWSKGGSKSSTTAGAAGIGFAAGPVVIGGGAAHSSSSSSSWQRGGRDVSASEEQNLRDAIRQYGDSLRAFEATVVTEVEQSESAEGVSEVVRNINYCHALSIVYYQILRHLRIDTEVAGVNECVFVPFKITRFDDARLKQHRDSLYRYIRDREQRIALRHIEHAPRFVIPEIPGTARKDQALTILRGSIQLRLGITRPTEGDIADQVEEGTTREKSETPRFKELIRRYDRYAPFLPMAPTEIVHNLLDITESERDRYFQRSIAPHIARRFVDKMRLGYDDRGTTTLIDTADFTLATTYRYGYTIRVDFQVRGPSDLTRGKTEKLIVQAPDAADVLLPERSFADVTGGRIEAATDLYERRIVARGGGRDDLLDPASGEPTTDGALLTFPTSAYEERNDRDEVKAAHRTLLDTLNRDLYRYHKLIWWQMDRDELYALLDGFETQDAFGEKRSLAGIVERRPIGILGNTLVFRVSPGIVLDEDLKTPEALLAFYSDGSHRDPLRVSLPTSGLYARAHMDSCSACERHEGTTDWVLDNPEPELADLPASLLQSRRAAPVSTTPTQLPETIINLQNAPDAPQTAGLGDILRTVSSSGAFRDMAGLAGTQENVRAGLQSATSLAAGFGNMAHQQAMARLASDASAAKEVAAVAAANQAAVEMGASTEDAARRSTETFMQRKAEGLAKEQAKRVADRADEIIRGEGGGTQTTVTEDGVQTVHKEPEPKRQPDPTAPYSVVPIPGTHQILFMNFDTGKSRLKADHVRALEILTGEIGLELENVVTIEGHASTSGTEEDNYSLGQDRARALFDKLYRLAEAIGTPPNYTPEFLRSTGEEGSYRERFRGVKKIAETPGDGHRNDPVEKAVLFTFKPSTDVSLEPKVVNFFGVEITISGHFIIIGNTIVASTPQGDVNVVDRSTTTVKTTSVTTEQITEDSRVYNINVEPGGILNMATDQGNLAVNIDQSTGQFGTPLVETAAEAQEHRDWLLQFSSPEIEESSERSLLDMVREITGIAASLTETPTNAPGILVDILTALAGAADDEDPVDIFLEKLGLDAVKPLLETVRFGNIKLKAEFKVASDPDTKAEGTLSASGVVIGTTKKAPGAIVLNNAPYPTSKALKASRWDDQTNLRDFVYVSNVIGSQATAIAEALLSIVEMLPFLPGHTLMEPVRRVMARLKGALDRLGTGSQVRFKAFEQDTALEAREPVAMPSGAEMQLVVMTPTMIAFNDD